MGIGFSKDKMKKESKKRKMRSRIQAKYGLMEQDKALESG